MSAVVQVFGRWNAETIRALWQPFQMDSAISIVGTFAMSCIAAAVLAGQEHGPTIAAPAADTGRHRAQDGLIFPHCQAQCLPESCPKIGDPRKLPLTSICSLVPSVGKKLLFDN
jgi:hypothetical protein